MQAYPNGSSFEKRDEETASDSDSSIPDVGCETCGVNFSSFKSYESHMQGKKHNRKVAQEKFVSKLLMKEKEKGETKNNDDDEDESSKLHCDVCDKYFSGHVSYMTHLKGSIHAKYVKKQKMKEEMADIPGVLHKDNKEISDEGDELIQKPFACCSACQKAFSGPEPFAAHMKSSAHKKKVALSKFKHSDESKNSDSESDIFAKCDACQKSFSGPIPYHTHMQSNIHRKNLEKNKVAEEMKGLCAEFDLETGYVCKECTKAFKDPLMFKNHLENNSHEKQKAKTALKEFLNKFPEIAFVTPFGDQNVEDSDDSSEEFYLICKICHTSFSGPESAQDHVQSKKHLNLKKEKRLLKLIKEQKKQLSDFGKAGDKTGSESNGDVKIKNDISTQGEASVAGKTNIADDFELI